MQVSGFHPVYKRTMSTPRAYLFIADNLRGLIESAAFKKGDRLPSIRSLVRTHGVSVPTVQRAMEELESRGYVEGRPRAGFYVCRRYGSSPGRSLPSRFTASFESTALSKVVQRTLATLEQPGICPLGPSGPSSALFPNLRLSRAMSAAVRHAGAHELDVFEVAGTTRLREEIARRSPDSGCCLRPQEIVIAAGCTEALSLCLRAVTSPGDTVAIESPAFYGLLLLLQTLKLNVIELPGNAQTGLDPGSVAEAIRRGPLAAVVVSGNFSHPTGALMPEAAKQKLVDLLARNGIPLIEDDIFGDLYFGARRPPPLKAYDRSGLVLLCDSFSKSVAPDYRIGWTAPGRFLDRILELKLAQCSFTATLPQLGIAEFLSRGGYERHLRGFRKVLSDNIRLTAAAVDRYFPSGTSYARPGGGNFLWIELPEGCDALALQGEAARHGVSFAPGPMFSYDATGFVRHLRLNCARIWTDKIERAIALLGELAARQLSDRIGAPPSSARN